MQLSCLEAQWLLYVPPALTFKNYGVYKMNSCSLNFSWGELISFVVSVVRLCLGVYCRANIPDTFIRSKNSCLKR